MTVGAFGVRDEPMRKHTSLHIGGPADYFVAVANERDLVGAVAIARENELPVFMLGGGTNLLVSDRGMRGVVLENNWNETFVDGLVISNTTTARPPGLASPAAHEAGGLSGRPLFQPATAVLGDFYRLTEGRLPLIGVGGVASGADAYAKIRAGASLVQLYTALVYHGPGLVGAIKRDLAALLRRDGFTSVAEATGADHRSGSAAG